MSIASDAKLRTLEALVRGMAKKVDELEAIVKRLRETPPKRNGSRDHQAHMADSI
jgi:hypothetical protein